MVAQQHSNSHHFAANSTLLKLLFLFSINLDLQDESTVNLRSGLDLSTEVNLICIIAAAGLQDVS